MSDPGPAAEKVGRFEAVRAVTIVGTVVVWAGLLALLGSVLGGALARPDISVGALRVTLGLVAPILGMVVAHGVVTGLVEGYALGRFAAPGASAARGRNPWVYAVLASAGCAPIGLIAGWFPSGPVDPSAFIGWVVVVGALSAAAAALYASGSPVRAEIAAIHSGARFAGDFAAYRFWRHALPLGLLNLAANGAVGLALVPPGGVAAPDQVVSDAVIATWIIAGAASFGARNVARGDARAGLVQLRPPGPSRLRQALGCALLGVVAGLVASALCAVVGPLSLPAFVAFKGLWSGAVAAVLAWAAAGWGAADGSAGVANGAA